MGRKAEGAIERPPPGRSTELSSLRWHRRGGRRRAARDPHPVVRRGSAVAVKLPAPLSEHVRTIRIRHDGRTARPHRRRRRRRQGGSARDPYPVVRDAAAVTVELPASLGIHDAIRRNRGGHRRGRGWTHDRRRWRRRRRCHDHRGRSRCLDLSASVHAASQHGQKYRRDQDRSNDASAHFSSSLRVHARWRCSPDSERGIFCATEHERQALIWGDAIA